MDRHEVGAVAGPGLLGPQTSAAHSRLIVEHSEEGALGLVLNALGDHRRRGGVELEQLLDVDDR